MTDFVFAECWEVFLHVNGLEFRGEHGRQGGIQGAGWLTRGRRLTSGG